MRPSQRKLFEQLEQRRKATTFSFEPQRFDSLFPETPSLYPKNTLGYLADQLGKTAEHLVEMFADAGLPGLSAEYQLLDEHKRRLLDFLKRRHASSAPLFEAPEPTDSAIVVVQSISEELIAQLSRSPDLLYELAPRRFEELVARLLEKQGCEVTLTKATRDGGYDILGRIKAGPANLLFLAECKRYAPDRKVGVEVIRGLYGVSELQKANYGLIVTTSSFSRDAMREQIRMGPRMQLAEYQDLRSWLNAACLDGT